MRRRHDNELSERNATALRRLAIIGARLAEDRRSAEPSSHPEVEDSAGAPPPAPDAGRHLAPSTPPRSTLLSGLHDRLPRSVHARLGGAGLTAHHVVVVVAVVVGFIAVAVWWLVSAQPSEVTALSPVESTSAKRASTSDGASSPEGSSSSSAATGKVVVDVTGKVRKPGIVSLRQGSRVADAIDAAGGPRSKRVDLRALNLARVLVDGEQIVVGLPSVAGATTPPATGSTTPGAAPPIAPINLNAATLEQLETLPGVGPVTGQSILDWRTENGRFTSVDELLEVDGIGEVTLADLRDLVTV
ncbi:MAG: ComEA family DNA-binding protein [Actinomycetia bacterium]|nr:ComEA family DNA-binding protein [Actinomycetes bacterium]